jgi:hypothetical protein
MGTPVGPSEMERKRRQAIRLAAIAIDLAAVLAFERPGRRAASGRRGDDKSEPTGPHKLGSQAVADGRRPKIYKTVTNRRSAVELGSRPTATGPQLSR